MAITVQVSAGAAALSRLDDAEFVADWERLRTTCSWATAFQSFAFVEAWYRLHEATYEPIIVEGRDDQGSLVGLLTLTRQLEGRSLVGAGDSESEYQTWLSTDAAVEPFMRQTLDELERSFPRARLSLTFLLPSTPLAWADSDSRWPRRIRLKTWTHFGGVIDLSDPAHIDASLRKSHNRNRMNVLRRLGEVRLETIDSVEGLLAVIDEIGVLCDLRQGAINGALPFTDDPLERRLQVQLMERGLLRVTILRVGQSIASAHLDLKNGNEVLMGVIAHAPEFARQSPGSLHILLLARQLASEGVSLYDLSPGGTYKDRFATGYRQVHRMSVQFGLKDRVVADLSGRAETLATRGLSPLGHTPRSALTEVRQFKTRAVSRIRGRSAPSTAGEDSVLLRLPAEPASATPERLTLDRPADLLGYDADRSDGPSMRRLLQLAIHRLESGHRVMTRMDGSLLAESWWLCRMDRPSGGPAKASESDLQGASAVSLYDPLVPTSPDGVVAGHVVLRRLRASLREIAPGATAYLSLSRREAALHASLVDAGAVQLEAGQGLTTSADKVSDGDGVSEHLAIAWPKRVVNLGVSFVGTALHDVMPFAREAAELLPA